MSRQAAGKGLQVLGLVLMPAAVIWGETREAFGEELIILAVAVSLLMMGRSLAAPAA